MSNSHSNDLSGTSGGLGSFVIGFAMICLGGYLLLNQVSIVGSYWGFYGPNTFGITLVPMLVGVSILFWSGRSTIGWLLTTGGALFIVAGVLANLRIYFQPTTLFNTVVMLVLLAGGLGSIARTIGPRHGRVSE